MQKLFFFFLLTCLTTTVNAQFRVLFIDDTDDGFSNAEYLASTLDSLGYEYVYIDAIGNTITPPASEMAEYDLVMWHTSSWGIDLQLWGGGDSINTELVQYLNMPNANLWLVGLDYFYDRYGAAPVTFQSGDFAYDYLGISKYASQSYADDGSLGVPLVTPAPDQPITGAGDLNWQFSTLWYADGFELRPDATPVYLFGGAGYALEGAPTAVWFRPASGARVLTYGFDLALTGSFDQMRDHVGTVLNWWQSDISATQTPEAPTATVQIAPNSFQHYMDIRVTVPETAPVSIRITNTTGQLIAEIANQVAVAPGTEQVFHWENTANLPNGLYYCTVQYGGQVHTTKISKI